jgi:hypothetical protein
MEFANANKVYRKSGGSPTIAFATSTSNPMGLRLTEGDEKGLLSSCHFP